MAARTNGKGSRSHADPGPLLPTAETLLNAIEALCDSAIEEDSVWADGLPSASRAMWVKKHLRAVLGGRR